MSLIVECDICGKTYKVADDKAGKKINCPNCGAVISVPLPVTFELPPNDDDRSPELLHRDKVTLAASSPLLSTHSSPSSCVARATGHKKAPISHEALHVISNELGCRGRRRLRRILRNGLVLAGASG